MSVFQQYLESAEVHLCSTVKPVSGKAHIRMVSAGFGLCGQKGRHLTSSHCTFQSVGIRRKEREMLTKMWRDEIT